MFSAFRKSAGGNQVLMKNHLRRDTRAGQETLPSAQSEHLCTLILSAPPKA